MLPEGINLIEDYAFNSSPESCTDNSFSSDAVENISDEDFMTQLSSSLDIPLLLSSGEDEMAVLNSFLDKSPDEILSDISNSPYYLFNDDMEVKGEYSFLSNNLELKNTKQQAQMSPTCHSNLSDTSQISYFDYLNRALDEHTVNIEEDIHIKSEMHSEESCSSSNSLEPSTPPPVSYNKANPAVFFATDVISKQKVATRSEKTSSVQVVPQVKVPIKRVPIKPKATISTKSSNIVLINNIKNEYANRNHNPVSSNIVVLDSIPVNNFSRVTPTTVNIPKTLSSMSVRGRADIDPRMLKRQERRIKNRESASMSRKKKKDYLNSLEDHVKQLSEENTRLVQENNSLKQRLAFYENGGKLSFNMSAKSAKPALVLCAFLLVVGINFNLTRNMFPLKPSKATVETDYPKLSEHFSRNLLWAADDGSEKLNSTYFSPLTMCPASINQTESARLLLELERWIGKPESKPATAPTAKLSKQKTKIKRKKLRLDSSLAQYRRHDRFGPENDLKTELEVFSPRLDQLYSEFYQAINRRDDTFYVVSFSEQHMLLPALYHNNTRRPKMSLLMPSMFPNETSTQTYVQLMQIDCEVLDTKLVNVKYATIPRPYRHYGNATEGTEASKTGSHYATTIKKYGPKRTYKPYVLSKNLLKGSDDN